MQRVQLALAGAVLAVFAQSAMAVSIWDEGVDGDLANDTSAPTLVDLGIGTNTITGSSQLADIDVFTITVPDDATFVSLLLTTFTSADDLAFLAIESGPVITDISSPANLLGWLHVSAAFAGTNILDDMASGAGALGFTPPLGPGTYTLWMQQTGPELVEYSFDLLVSVSEVPEPPMAMLFAFGLVALAVARRRRG
jgi:MYXO-CTERM domain-containing protein